MKRSEKPWRLVVRGILRDRRGRYLLLQRSLKNRGWPLHWEFPGGKVDPGENVGAAVVREFKEETGLQVRPLRVLAGFDRERECDRLVYLMFEVKRLHGRLRISQEHERFGWFTQTQLPQVLLSPPLIKLVKTL